VDEFPGANLRIFAVWEQVLATDIANPSNATLARMHDPRAAQFWDRSRLLSHLLGEKDRASIVWDNIAIYAPGQLWTTAPPAPAFSGRTIVKSVDQTAQELRHLLSKDPAVI